MKQRERLFGLLAEAKTELKQYYDDIGGCDHSVGLCACGLERLIAAISDELDRENRRIERRWEKQMAEVNKARLLQALAEVKDGKL